MKDISLKKIKNPYKDSWLVEHEKIRTSALKWLAKLRKIDFDCKAHWNSKIDNIFSTNKQLVKLIKKDPISLKDFEKINSLILSDYVKLQKDLDIAEKNKSLSSENILKKRISSASALYNLSGLMKTDEVLFHWKKATEFCKKNKIKVGVVSSAIFVWLFSNFSLPNTVSFAWDVTPNVEIVSQEKNSIYEIKPRVSFSDYSLWDLLDIDQNSAFFNETKDLYWNFMNQTLSLKNSSWNINVDSDYLKDFLKAELMFTNWTINHLNKKIIPWDINSDITQEKIDYLDIQYDILFESYNSPTIDSFSYKKFGEVITIIKKNNWTFDIFWLDNFEFNS